MQPTPDGIAQAFLIGRDWITGQACALALGANLIHGDQQPLHHGELEITDLNRVYLQDSSLRVEWLSRGYAWLDAGTPDSLIQAATYVQTIQSRTGMLVGCPKEVAFRMGFIDAAQLRDHAKTLAKTKLGRVLHELAEGVHL